MVSSRCVVTSTAAIAIGGILFLILSHGNPETAAQAGDTIRDKPQPAKRVPDDRHLSESEQGRLVVESRGGLNPNREPSITEEQRLTAPSPVGDDLDGEELRVVLANCEATVDFWRRKCESVGRRTNMASSASPSVEDGEAYMEFEKALCIISAIRAGQYVHCSTTALPPEPPNSTRVIIGVTKDGASGFLIVDLPYASYPSLANARSYADWMTARAAEDWVATFNSQPIAAREQHLGQFEAALGASPRSPEHKAILNGVPNGVAFDRRLSLAYMLDKKR